DSAVRVGYGDRLLERIGVTVRGDLSRSAEPVLVRADDGGGPVVVYPVPYLDPLATAHVADPEGGSSAAGPSADGGRRRFTHHDSMTWAMGRARADLLARSGGSQPVRSVVVAHTFLTG